ncbi:uncharacterized protein EV422DRAFT_104303 [Fimicolochytrium jonesii]|uniref:uncharacterized protein n=1 Tax=Fimicolochytrium jonesii TaxID=1396493 RepID=UPI0022FDF002|nr:uncharacterized protein EV422DRAFT_104303 [Fimicolochytrium jonesii]KAI8819721.1 hypothetical protein EV422DRAFT_104303 [Fimicolochytrium jonesii]
MSLSPWIPEGTLPKFLLLVGTAAFYNGLQCFVPKMRVTGRIYSLQPVQATPLMARMMGLWTLTSGVVRVYAAYNISDPAIYAMTMWTFAFALFSFTTEVFVHKTAPVSSPGVWPALLISPISLFWMWTQYGHYVR